MLTRWHVHCRDLSVGVQCWCEKGGGAVRCDKHRLLTRQYGTLATGTSLWKCDAIAKTIVTLTARNCKKSECSRRSERRLLTARLLLKERKTASNTS